MPEPIIPHIEAFREGDELSVTYDGQTNHMIVHRILDPGTMARRISAGPRIMCHIRPGGYAVSFDYDTLFAGIVEVAPATTCREFLDNGSCIHSDHTK
jgi:hypothetical protein